MANGESTANETKNLYHKKLVKLQKEYDKSKKELDEAQKKIAQLENTGNFKKIISQTFFLRILKRGTTSFERQGGGTVFSFTKLLYYDYQNWSFF